MVMPHIITNSIYTLVDRFTTSEVMRLANKPIRNTTTACPRRFPWWLPGYHLILGVIVYLLNKRAFYYN